MAKLLEWIKTRFFNYSYGQELEAYIMSKNPKSSGDIENWTKEFDRRAINRRFGL